MFLKRFFVFAALASLLMLAVGCGEEENKIAKESNQPTAQTQKNDKRSTEKPKTEEKILEVDVTLYYPDDNGTKLFGVKRHIKLAGRDKYTAAIETLMAGPVPKGQTAIIPRRAKLLGVKVEGDTAKVNFSRELSKNFVGGSTGEEFLVGSIVNTLTSFKEVNAVQILIEGQEVESISGHMDLSVPIKRMDSLL